MRLTHTSIVVSAKAGSHAAFDFLDHGRRQGDTESTTLVPMDPHRPGQFTAGLSALPRPLPSPGANHLLTFIRLEHHRLDIDDGCAVDRLQRADPDPGGCLNFQDYHPMQADGIGPVG